MARIYDNDTGALIGEVADEALQFLFDQLEEESSEDTDYYVNQDTIDLLRANGASAELTVLLERAIAGKGEAEIRWESE